MEYVADVWGREQFLNRDEQDKPEIREWFAKQFTAEQKKLTFQDEKSMNKIADFFPGYCTTYGYAQSSDKLLETVIDDALEPIVAHLIIAHELVQCALRKRFAPFQFELIIACDNLQKASELKECDEDAADTSVNTHNDASSRVNIKRMLKDSDLSKASHTVGVSLCLNENERSHEQYRDDLERIIGAFRDFLHATGSIRHRRLCMFVDRRRRDDEKQQHGDLVTFYKPPKGANELEEQSPAGEDFFGLSRSKNCLFPHDEHMLTFSFHVISADIVRCYLNRGGHHIRFLPGDIKDILPSFFTERQDNTQFLKNEEHICTLVARLKYYDKFFRAWYDQQDSIFLPSQ